MMKPPSRGRPAKYPWDLWMDGEQHSIIQNVDFFAAMRSMEIYLRAKARSHGKKVTISLNETSSSIVFRFFDIVEEVDGDAR